MSNDPPSLSGTVPGRVDPSQPSRLLRTPTSSFFFAAFDPLTARANAFPNLSSLHIDPNKSSKRVVPDTVTGSNGKRIVIETDPENGTCCWRFVPRARTENELLGNEGPFPRLIELCGRLVHMTQDQWDIYKLDPEYHCLVRIPPNLTTITRITSHKNTLDSDDTFVSDLPDTSNITPEQMGNTPTPKSKQDYFPACSASEGPQQERYKSTGAEQTFSYETDSMAVDEDTSCMPNPQVHQIRVQDGVNRMKRRRVPDRLGERKSSEAGKMTGTASRRRESSMFTNLSSNLYSGDGGVNEIPTKKFRTRSPGTVRRELEQKRIKREAKRNAHMKARLKLRRDGLHRAFWNGLGIPQGLHDPGLYENLNDSNDSDSSEKSEDEADDGSTAPSDPTTDGEEEAERLTKIEESRRKLADLEKDKPLWEESARRRQAREREEEHMRQRAKLKKEEEEHQRQHAQAGRRQREEKREHERLERQREVRMREQSGRMFVLAPRVLRWSFRHALERYLETSASFDATKFTAGAKPITFAAIPWPVLHSSFSIQEIEWDAVEMFFAKVKGLLTTAEFKDLVEKSHRRFHPDRWRSRGLLLSAKDSMERDLLEVAGSTVAQAITPLWKQTTGR